MGDIIVKKFMVEDLKLKGNELVMYALIYGYENHTIKASMNYIGKLTGLSGAGVYKILNQLIDKKLISKNKVEVNGIHNLEYAVLKEM